VLALPNVWMLVVPAATLMAAVLLSERVGLLLAVSLSALAGLSANGGLYAAVLALGSSLAGLTYLSHIWPPSRLRRIVGAMSITNVALLVTVGLLQGQSPLAPGGMRDLAFGALLYSPLATAIAVGGIFVLQRPFGITTHLGLLELSNPQHPLLKHMQAEAPGTYFACVTVANLADAAAEAVGADSLLARVGALYHDIGKLTRPPFFVENQALLGTDNVHDNLSSSLSGLIIMSHVKDGVEMARRERLPQEVEEIIEQHHGTTLVSYFYHRALSGDRPESVSEEHFRYPGPLPRSKEAALVMLADSVQAAVKSIADPTPQRVQQMVRDVVRDRVVGGQLAECDLTFRDVVAAEATMSRLLTALLCHGRIEYPEQVSTGMGV
jgi:cyclic-di-AMP phosphodiesterase PgpH